MWFRKLICPVNCDQTEQMEEGDISNGMMVTLDPAEKTGN